MESNLNPKIYCDTRELRSHVITELEKLGADITIVEMEVGDFCLSGRVCIERKDVADCLKSWIDEKKLFGQIYDMSHAYERPLLVIEGGENALYESRRIMPQSVREMLSTMAISFRCPVMFTTGTKETAQLLYSIAKREQDEKPGYFTYHGKRTHLSPAEQLIYLTSSIPDIGRITATNLLKHFGTVQAVANAEPDELDKVPLVGDVQARKIYEFFRRVFRNGLNQKA